MDEYVKILVLKTVIWSHISIEIPIVRISQPSYLLNGNPYN